MPARHQAAVDLGDEQRNVIGHLRQGGTSGAALLALVAVGEMIENTAILRVEEGDGDGAGRQEAEEAEPLHLEAAVEGQPHR